MIAKLCILAFGSWLLALGLVFTLPGTHIITNGIPHMATKAADTIKSSEIRPQADAGRKGET